MSGCERAWSLQVYTSSIINVREDSASAADDDDDDACDVDKQHDHHRQCRNLLALHGCSFTIARWIRRESLDGALSTKLLVLRVTVTLNLNLTLTITLTLSMKFECFYQKLDYYEFAHPNLTRKTLHNRFRRSTDIGEFKEGV